MQFLQVFCWMHEQHERVGKCSAGKGCRSDESCSGCGKDGCEGDKKKGGPLTTKQRAAIPKGDFAVPGGSKSSGGKPAYPIPDKVHARAALGFSAMHGNSADIAAVKAKVKAKFPDMNVNNKKP